jgi:hypothetical protein
MKFAVKLHLGKHLMTWQNFCKVEGIKPATVRSFQLCHQLTTLHLTSKTKHILPGLDPILYSSICFWDPDASIQVDKCVCEHGY